MKKIVAFCFILAMLQTAAQELKPSLLSASGGYFENNNYALSWSLGEMVIETLVQSNAILTQGFQQSKLFATSVKEYTGVEFLVDLYPNPATEHLYIEFQNGLEGKLKVKIFDLMGNLQWTQPIIPPHHNIEIDVQQLETGMYFLKLVGGDGELLQTLKFQKTE